MPGDVETTFNLFAIAIPIIFGVVAVLVIAGLVFTIASLVRNRKRIAKYQQDVLELPGAILDAVKRGDLAGAQLLQQQLELAQRSSQATRFAAAPIPPIAGPMGPSGPTGVPGDINGDGIPGN